MKLLSSLAALSCSLVASSSAVAQPRSADLNAYILKAVADTYAEYKGRGYDADAAYSHDLQYGHECCIKATRPPVTMCVAAVAEVIVRALSDYAKATGDYSPFTKLPMSTWSRGGVLDFRAHAFKQTYVGTDGKEHQVNYGFGGAVKTFGIGKEIRFSELRPGDLVTFNRTKTGHAVVFLGYLDQNGKILSSFGSTVAGFKFFSAQGKGKPDAGFGYRYGFFGNHCPSLDGGRVVDCGIRKSDDQSILNTAYLLAPSKWTTKEAFAQLVRRFGPIALTQSRYRRKLAEAALASAQAQADIASLKQKVEYWKTAERVAAGGPGVAGVSLTEEQRRRPFEAIAVGSAPAGYWDEP